MAKKYILDVRRHGNSDRGTLREGKGFCMKGHQPLLRNSASSVAPLHLEFVYEYQPAASNLTIFWNENVSRLVHFSSAHAYMHRHVLFYFLLFLFFLFFRFHTFLPFPHLSVYEPLFVISLGHIMEPLEEHQFHEKHATPILLCFPLPETTPRFSEAV